MKKVSLFTLAVISAIIALTCAPSHAAAPAAAAQETDHVDPGITGEVTTMPVPEPAELSAEDTAPDAQSWEGWHKVKKWMSDVKAEAIRIYNERKDSSESPTEVDTTQDGEASG